MSIDRRKFLRSAATYAGAAAIGGAGGWSITRALAAEEQAFPDEVLNPVEVSGADAMPVIGKLPARHCMYMLPSGAGEHHRVGSMLMTRVATPAETGDTYELVMFAGRTGAALPRHRHLGSHAAFLVMEGEIELELDGDRWRMLRGDFANIPPGVPHAWTMQSDRSRIALFTMGNRVGKAFAAMGTKSDATAPSQVTPVAAGKLADAAFNGDFQLVSEAAPARDAVRVSNLLLPSSPGPYVLLDAGGERYGGNTFYAKNPNTNGQFLFIVTEGGAGPGVGAHFHARHTEDFFALDGEILGWAYGKAVPLRSGDFFHAPPRHLHGFKMTQAYNRFVGFLTPGIFENFFTRGQPGRNGVGRTFKPNADSNNGQGAATPERRGPPPGAGGAPSAPSNAMFRALAMSSRGPDGYPLDVHGAKLPLPPQDPVWLEQRIGALEERRLLMEHALICSGRGNSAASLTPELRAALALKPRAEEFV